MGWNTELIDIKTVFLHDVMEETIHINLPICLNSYSGRDENDDTECMILKKCILWDCPSGQRICQKVQNTWKLLHYKMNWLDRL